MLLANNETTGDGGGLGIVGAATQTTILNSTISGNLARRGGGIAANRTVIIRNSTIAENTAGEGGGIYVLASDAVVNVRNSIIANNVDSDQTNSVAPNRALEGNVPILLGTNLSSDESCGTDPSILDWEPSARSPGEQRRSHEDSRAQSGQPGDRGGTTCSEPTDQRYVARPQGVTCDIGAFELDQFATVTLAIDPNVAVDAKTGRPSSRAPRHALRRAWWRSAWR